MRTYADVCSLYSLQVLLLRGVRRCCVCRRTLTYADVCSLYSLQVLLLRGVIPRIEAVAETLLRPLAPALPDLMQEHQMSLTKVSGPGGSLVKMPTLPEGNSFRYYMSVNLSAKVVVIIYILKKLSATSRRVWCAVYVSSS